MARAYNPTLNPYELYSRGARAGGSYPGSSGYTMGSSNRYAGTVPGAYAGDYYRGKIAQRYGVQLSPSQRIAQESVEGNPNAQLAEQSRYATQTGTQKATGGPEDWETMTTIKNPAMDTAITGAQKQWTAATAITVPGFTEAMKKAQSEIVPKVQADLATAGRYTNLDTTAQKLGGYDEGYRAAMEGQISDYARAYSDMVSKQDAVAAERRANAAKWNDYLTRAEQLATGAGALAASRYGISANNAAGAPMGLSGEIPRIASEATIRYLLPEYQKATAFNDQVLASEQGLRAAQEQANAQRFGFNAPAYSSIFSRPVETTRYLNALATQYPGVASEYINRWIGAAAAPGTALYGMLGSSLQPLSNIAALIPSGRYEGLSYKPGIDMAERQYYPAPLAYPMPTQSYAEPDLGALMPQSARYAGEATATGTDNPLGGIAYRPLPTLSTAAGNARWNALAPRTMTSTASGDLYRAYDKLGNMVDRYGRIVSPRVQAGLTENEMAPVSPYERSAVLPEQYMWPYFQ